LINRFRAQWEQDVPDEFETEMPVELFRVTWKEKEEFYERWFGSQKEALEEKWAIDHSNGVKSYVNFERWYGYRDKEHDRLVRPIPRERGWWE
jgi:hypothetical protein